jgi:hypothetical protein
MFALALVPLLACSFDEAAPGVRGQCATAVGEPVCDSEAIETGEDACWKLVECGSIPVVEPVPDDDDYFDQPQCELFFQRLSEHRYDVSLACIEAASCDQLRFEGGPDTPTRNPEGMPPCLEYGDQ